MLQQCLPLTWPFNQEGLVETTAGWTAYVNNSSLWGTDPAPIGELAMLTGCRAIELSILPHTLVKRAGKMAGCAGVMRFTLYAPKSTDWINVTRSVSVCYEDKWKFASIGEPLPFERIDKYAAPVIRNRLSADDVIDYCAALGIKPYDLTVYGQAASVLRYEDRSSKLAPETRADAQQRLRFSAQLSSN